ncbi:MAG: DeoR/GlpR transcriptional regulator [Spirochaetales bacterium]|jgi:DeoR/GlpR family transcriptional regulator of sugar metabolism|nr:DeoR/GlpR transcriptional regulator [Spirochaetales bacterium]
MGHIPRHDEILNIITRLRNVTVQELTERLGVSEVTIRKDLTILEEMGALLRTHGGAKLAEDRALLRTLRTRMMENPAEKKIISARARELVNEGDTVYLDSGSTCFYLAEEIRDMTLRVLTNSIDVMTVLADAPGVSLFSVGGSYRMEAGSFLGPIAEENVRRFQIETCFIGVTGISEDGAFSSQNVFESQLKRQVIEISQRKVVLADSSKLDTSAFSVFATAEDIDVLIIDSDPGFGNSVEKLEILVTEERQS